MTKLIFNKDHSVNNSNLSKTFDSSTSAQSTNSNSHKSTGEVRIKEEVIKERELLSHQITENLKTNQSQVKNLSLLNNIDGNPHLAKLISAFEKGEIDPVKALASINLSYSSKSTGYEGWTIPENAKLYSTLFEAIRSGGGVFSKDITPEACASVDQLKKGLNLDAAKLKVKAQEIMEEILKLEVGKSYCMEGGWYGNPSGHAMIYRFKRISPSQFDIYIYDAQANSEGRKGGKKETRRNSTPPYIKLAGVYQDEIFFGGVGKQSTLFLENLLFLKVPTYKNYNSSYVLTCFAHIMHYAVPTKSLPPLFISMQRSGNCPKKSLNCLLLDLIGDPKQYKKLSLDDRLLTIIASYEALRKKTYKTSFERDIRMFQLKEASSNFLRVLNANFKRPDLNIDSDAYRIACATIFDIEKELEDLEKELQNIEGKPHQLKATYDKAENSKLQQVRKELNLSLPKNFVFNSVVVPTRDKSLENLGLGKGARWSDLEKIFSELNSIIEGLEKNQNKQNLIFQVEVLFRNLSHLKNEKSDLTSDQALILLEKLTLIQDKYNAAVFELNEITSPSFQNTGMECLALAYKLALNADKNYKVLEEFGLAVDFFYKFVNEQRLFTIQDPILLEQRNQLIQYFNLHKCKSQQIFNLNDLTFNPTFIDFLEGDTPDGKLYKKYIASNDKIANEFLLQSQKFKISEFESYQISPMHGAIHSLTRLDYPSSLKHLRLLKVSSLYAHEACMRGKSSHWGSDQISLVRDNLEVQTKRSEWITKLKSIETMKSFFQDFSPEAALESYTKHMQSSHKISDIESENSLIISISENPELPFYLPLAAPDIQVSLLLSSLESHLELLSEPKKRLLIGHMLIKVIENADGGLVSPLMESLKKEPLLLSKFERLMILGKKYFVDAMPKATPRLEETLFLMRQYARALQILCSLYPDYVYPEQTLQLIKELTAYLDYAQQLPNLTDSMKRELQMAKVGLLLGRPLKQLTKEQQADLFFTMLTLKNTVQKEIRCADPSFWRECQRKWFNSQEWDDILRNSGKCKDFADAVINKICPMQPDKWSVNSYQLIYVDNSKEKWIIDLKEPAIRNTKGELIQKTAQLKINNSIQRLFKNQSYELKVFGEEIWFKDSKWGQIKLTQKGNNTLIQRQINDKWFTYINAENEFRSQVKINDALFFDHAIWFDLNNPNDMRFYDLKTGEEVCHTEKDGAIYNQKGQLLSMLKENDCPLWKRFEDINQINCWIDQKESKEKEANGILEFSRFRSKDGVPLNFTWDKSSEKWIYFQNSDFHLDTQSDKRTGFQVNRFIPLINSSRTKQKLLIPLGKIVSRGYSPLAGIVLENSKDGQKGNFTFFEYDIVDGQVVPQTLDAKIYLAHLYLAQKNYQKALELLKSISVSEQFSPTTIQLIQALFNSCNDLSDASPNACAIRLYAYYFFCKINPHAEFSSANIFDNFNYLIYLKGSNNLENPLILDLETELELIDFLKVSLNKQFSLTGHTQENIELNLLIPKREKVLKGEKVSSTLFYMDYPQNNTSYKKNFSICSHYFSDISLDKPAGLKSYFTDEYSESFLSKFEDFERCYQILRNESPDFFEYKAVCYELLTHQTFHSINSDRLDMLSIAMYAKEDAPSLPQKGASVEEKLLCYQKWKEIHEKYSEEKSCTYTSEFINGLQKIIFSSPSPAIIREVGSVENPGFVKPPFRLSHSNNNPTSISLAREGQDQLFESWQDKYLEPQGAIQLQKLQKVEAIPVNLKVYEKKYFHSIKDHMDHYVQDCNKAYLNDQEKRVFKKEVDLKELAHVLQVEHRKAQEHETKLKNLINQLAVKASFDFSTYVQHRAEQLGQRRPTPKLETILRAATQENAEEALHLINPDLDSSEVRTLRETCLEFMIEATHRQHLERIIKPLDKWFREGLISSLEQAQEALNEGRGYDPQQSLFPLLFEFLSGLRVRPKQAKIIDMVLQSVFESKKLNSEDQEELIGKVFQLIMAGGKTSVILSMLVELVAEKGLMACVMSHPSQMTSVTGSLADHQSKRFSKDIYILEYTIQDLAKPEILDIILKKLQEADRKESAVIMKTSLPQILELKFFIELLRLPAIKEKTARDKQGNFINKLRMINKILKDKGIGFFDECDINLSMLLDVIIPLGQRKNVKPERATLVLQIYECLIKDEEISKLVNLQKNQQTELSFHDLENKIFPFIAEKMFSYQPLKLFSEPELKQAFSRYVCNQIDREDQILADQPQADIKNLDQKRQENVKFLRYFAELAKSDNRYHREAADLISLVRRVSQKILRLSFARSYNRGYGKDPIKNNGSIVPFLGSRSPATTQFGNVYLALAYQAQSSINDIIDEEEIKFLATKMCEAANYYATKEKKDFNQTLEALQFQEMTSITLNDLHSAEKLKQASNFINDPLHYERRLAFTAEIAPFHVYDYAKKIGSNAINGVSKFKNAVGFSGILWNHSTYHRGFGAPALDEGTEGSLLNLLTEKAKKQPNCIHSIKNTNLESFFNLIHHHPEKKRLRGLVDGGGFLRDYSNNETPIAFSEFFEKEKAEGGPPIEWIIYLHKFSAAEIQNGSPPESFALLKVGTKERKFLKNTSEEEIEKCGVKKENLFALIDELRGSGTNIILDPQALFLDTVDHHMPIRTFLQEVSRARSIFKDQTAEYVVTDKGRAEMINGGKTFTDMKDTLIKNEAIMLKDQKDRARFAQIDDVVRSAIAEEFYNETDIDMWEKLIINYESFLISGFDDNPYEQDGRIEGLGNTFGLLSAYANRLLDRFKLTESPSYSAVQKKMERLLEKFKAEISPDEMMELSKHEDLNATIELQEEQELKIELEKESKIELNKELQTELNRYNFETRAISHNERPWNLNSSEPLWKQLSAHFSKATSPNLLSVPEILSRTYRDQISTKEYVSCFPNNFFMSENFYRTTMEELPIFHKYSKQPGFLLVIENALNQPSQFVLLSEEDSAYFKKLLEGHPQLCAHLVDLKGHPEINANVFNQRLKDEVKFAEAFKEGLWYANLFAANVDYLDDQEILSKKLMGKKAPLMAKFLQLKLAHKQDRLRQLFTSDLFNLQKETIQNLQITGILFSKRREEIEQRYNQTRKLGQEAVANLPPQEVENITPQQVGWLITKEQVKFLPITLINHLKPSQIDLLDLEKIPLLTDPKLIQALHTPEQLKRLSIDQLKHIIPNQVQWLENIEAYMLSLPDERGLTYKQKGELKKCFLKITNLDEKYIKNWHLPYLSDSQLSNLKNADLIRSIPIGSAHTITKEQAIHLGQKERELIPRLNYPAFLGIQPSLSYLLKESQIKQLQPTDAFIKRLTAKQAASLKKEALQFIDLAIVNDLSDEDIRKLEAVPLLFALNAKNLAKIIKAQEKIIEKELENITKTEEISRLRDDQLKFIPDTKVDLVPYQKALFLTDRQWKHFTKEQWNQLVRGQITAIKNLNSAAMNEKFVNFLNKEVLENPPVMKPNNLNGKTISKAGYGHRELIQGIQSATLISKLNDQALQNISIQQLNMGLALVSEKDFQRLVNPELLLQAPTSYVKSLLPNQEKILRAQIQLLPPDNVASHYLKYLLDDQVCKLTDKEKIKTLPDDKIALLKYHQVLLFKSNELEESFVKKLGEEGIEALNHEDYAQHSSWLLPSQLKWVKATSTHIIQKLSVDNFCFLSDTALQQIAENQVNLLKVQDQNRLQRPELLLALSKESIQKLDNTCLTRLKTLINALNDASKLQNQHLQFLENPILLAKLPPHLFALLTKEQLLLLKEADNLSKDQIQNLPVDKVKYISNRYVPDLSLSQISQLSKENSEQIAHLTEEQIRQFELFPSHLIEDLPDSSLKFLAPNKANLKQISVKRRFATSDRKLVRSISKLLPQSHKT